MSKRLLAACGLMLAIAAVPAARAQVTIDMSKVTCEQFLGYKIVNPNDIAMWLSGYYNASVRSTVIDLNEFAQAAKTVKDYCQTTPQSTVMSAAERALGIKMPRSR